MRKFSIAAAAMIALASLQCTGISATTAEFKDVPDTSPYFAYIHDLKTLGITDGIAEGVYGPETDADPRPVCQIRHRRFSAEGPRRTGALPGYPGSLGSRLYTRRLSGGHR